MRLNCFQFCALWRIQDTPAQSFDFITKFVRTLPIFAGTGNPSSTDFQGDLQEKQGLAVDVIQKSQTWNVAGHIGYVVGATHPNELAVAREMAAGANFLIPGVGAQGGSLEAAVRFGRDAVAAPVINSSRGIIYAGNGLDYADVARTAAQRLRDQINELL